MLFVNKLYTTYRNHLNLWKKLAIIMLSVFQQAHFFIFVNLRICCAQKTWSYHVQTQFANFWKNSKTQLINKKCSLKTCASLQLIQHTEETGNLAVFFSLCWHCAKHQIPNALRRHSSVVVSENRTFSFSIGIGSPHLAWRSKHQPLLSWMANRNHFRLRRGGEDEIKLQLQIEAFFSVTSTNTIQRSVCVGVIFEFSLVR